MTLDLARTMYVAKNKKKKRNSQLCSDINFNGVDNGTSYFPESYEAFSILFSLIGSGIMSFEVVISCVPRAPILSKWFIGQLVPSCNLFSV